MSEYEAKAAKVASFLGAGGTLAELVDAPTLDAARERRRLWEMKPGRRHLGLEYYYPGDWPRQVQAVMAALAPDPDVPISGTGPDTWAVVDGWEFDIYLHPATGAELVVEWGEER
jgi:hypothetical protein